MAKIEVSTNDAARGIYRVHVIDAQETDVNMLLKLQEEVNSVLKSYGLETRFVNVAQEMKKDEKTLSKVEST